MVASVEKRRVKAVSCQNFAAPQTRAPGDGPISDEGIKRPSGYAAIRGLWISADLSKLRHCRWNTNCGTAVYYPERFQEAAESTREVSHMSTEKSRTSRIPS